MGTSNTKGASLGGSDHVQLPSLLLFWIPRPCHSGVRQLAYEAHFDILLPPYLYRLRHPEVLKSMMLGGKLLSNPVTFALASKPVSGARLRLGCLDILALISLIMSQHTAPAHMPKLDFTMGAIEIGVLVSTLLYGMTVVQSYIYFASNAPDRLWLKSFVALVR
jgi:hypothetical protein